MASLSDKKKRTILVLGPPHSGKSTFSCLLFRALRGQGEDAALIDADAILPTYRAYNMVSNQEHDHLYATPHRGKRRAPPLEVYKNYVKGVLWFVREEGPVV